MNNNPKKILLIDDDPDVKAIYEQVLTHAGYLFEYAKDGEEGYSKIIKGGFDLILLDIMMPKTDGVAVLRKLKSNPPSGVANGPIIVLSQLSQTEILNSALELGAKGYIIKTDVEPTQIIGSINRFLQNPQAQ
jgi:DNA-binding response OmpR family regulator